MEAAKSGVSVLSLCEKGDAMIMEETGKIFKKEKDMKKGMCSFKTLYFNIHHTLKYHYSSLPSLLGPLSCLYSIHTEGIYFRAQGMSFCQTGIFMQVLPLEEESQKTLLVVLKTHGILEGEG